MIPLHVKLEFNAFPTLLLTIAGEAVGGLGKRALKQSALEAIPHGVRLRWMVGGDLEMVSVPSFFFINNLRTKARQEKWHFHKVIVTDHELGEILRTLVLIHRELHLVRKLLEKKRLRL